MKRILLFFCAILALALMGSCATSGAAPAATAPSETVTTRTVTDTKGNEVEIPTDPQRIVVIDFNGVEELLALGITPAGILYDPPAHLADQLANVEVVGTDGAPNLEAILQLDPDLIIAVEWWIDDTIYAQLGEIAPTVMIDRQNFREWKQYLRNMGELVGRSDQAEQLLAEYDEHVAEVSAAIGEDTVAQTEVSSFRPYGDGSAFLIWLNSFSDSILADIGLQRPQAQWDALPEGEERIDNVSLEMIPLLDADVIFTVAPWTDDTTSFFNALQDNPVWQQLRAVQADQVFEVSGPWNEGSVIAAHLVLDDILAALAPDAVAESASAETSSDAADTGCRLITHDMGETEVCGTPKTVVP